MPQHLAVTEIKDAMTREPKGPREVERAVERAYKTELSGNPSPRISVPAFDLDLLASRASRVPFEVTADYLAEASPECVLDVTPAQYLDAVFGEGERVAVVHPMCAETGTGVYLLGRQQRERCSISQIRQAKQGWHMVRE
jgi:hypothetical protein